ncbi:hypothetical protein GCM10015535_16770 [Streptomyces gelaticus]|uniref:Integrase n=1 Tax=Streptomyces gelaticus TaxID=285446 RepID=A0ABQ2VUE8_9ACTN|nr:hypothetical protein GCM10015535_16770 [Streptomyces gelaticus]
MSLTRLRKEAKKAHREPQRPQTEQNNRDFVNDWTPPVILSFSIAMYRSRSTRSLRETDGKQRRTKEATGNTAEP